MSRRTDFITLTRQLASQFVEQSAQFQALAAEFTFGGYGGPVEAGGLGPDDFVGPNEGLNQALMIEFYTNLGMLLAGMTDEQRVIFYKMRS